MIPSCHFVYHVTIMDIISLGRFTSRSLTKISIPHYPISRFFSSESGAMMSEVENRKLLEDRKPKTSTFFDMESFDRFVLEIPAFEADLCTAFGERSGDQRDLDYKQRYVVGYEATVWDVKQTHMDKKSGKSTSSGRRAAPYRHSTAPREPTTSASSRWCSGA